MGDPAKPRLTSWSRRNSDNKRVLLQSLRFGGTCYAATDNEYAALPDDNSGFWNPLSQQIHRQQRLGAQSLEDGAGGLFRAEDSALRELVTW